MKPLPGETTGIDTRLIPKLKPKGLAQIRPRETHNGIHAIRQQIRSPHINPHMALRIINRQSTSTNLLQPFSLIVQFLSLNTHQILIRYHNFTHTIVHITRNNAILGRNQRDISRTMLLTGRHVILHMSYIGMLLPLIILVQIDPLKFNTATIHFQFERTCPSRGLTIRKTNGGDIIHGRGAEGKLEAHTITWLHILWCSDQHASSTGH
mmetsp:Transcript_6688/g.9906  ORF Transcript_6688/g.9906 Transcript_6688/m.9906 type:complete len:209 (+) Transcript_6688:1036-1662(+)